MENNERKNDRGIFYAIMGVATLVITLIGATFAYFVATTNSTANAITTGSTTVTLSFDDNTVTNTKVDTTDGNSKALHVVTDKVGAQLSTGIKGSLIPVDTICTAADVTADQSLDDSKKNCKSENSTSIAFALKGYNDTTAGGEYRYAGAGQYDCRDSNGNNICSVYSFTVTNSANVAQTIYPSFKVKTNGFINLKYAVFKGTPAQVDANITKGWDVNGVPVETTTTAFASGDPDVLANGGVSFANTISTTAVRKKVIANPGDLVISARTVGADGSTESWLQSQVSGKYSSITGESVTTTDWTTSDKSNIAANWNRLVQILDQNESLTYTMIFWIEETYSNQSPGDMTKNFEAQVAFTTEGSGTGVTGSLIMR